ncbi:hypothetical protein F4694_000967 [Bacillus niacini]|uniref:Uncharacterized protein n=1 Tax=Neobacillus niacini TaxID=86668 RepID=A0A852T6F1_9BACI|nr:hypothetical protein [Neobacillus niacini]
MKPTQPLLWVAEEGGNERGYEVTNVKGEN